MQKTINLFTTKGCPKCGILRKKCAESPVIAESDFREIMLDPNDECDKTLISHLVEHNMTTFPVLEVDDDLFDFNQALQFIKG